jgi:phosphohistidine phosphatase
MIIHVVRHAEAVERSQDIPEDHRFLTRRGRKRFRKIAGSMKKLGTEPDLILTSPLIRAVQTADILAETLRFKRELKIVALLSPGFQPSALDQLLDDYPQANEIALVGHEPDLGALAQALLATEESCTLKKGAVISFKRTAGAQGKAEFLHYVTGGGKIISSLKKTVEHLQAENTKRMAEKRSV